MSQPLFVFIATGIGITPFRSMIRSLIDTNTSLPILLLYKAQAQEILFKAMFQQAEKYAIHTIYMPEHMSLDGNVIKEYIADQQAPTYFLSGPQPIVEEQRRMLIDLGIPGNKIKTDLFSGYA